MDCLYTFTKNPITFYSCGNLVSPGGFLHQRRTLHCHVLSRNMAREARISPCFSGI